MMSRHQPLSGCSGVWSCAPGELAAYLPRPLVGHLAASRSRVDSWGPFFAQDGLGSKRGARTGLACLLAPQGPFPPVFAGAT